MLDIDVTPRNKTRYKNQPRDEANNPTKSKQYDCEECYCFEAKPSKNECKQTKRNA